MKQEVLSDPTLHKAAATSIAGAGVSIATVNEYLTLIALVVSVTAGIIAIYRGWIDLKEKRDKK